MRCYMMRRGRIFSVEMLTPGTDDSLIEQARAHFDSRSRERFDGFEVWDGSRKVFRHPPENEAPNSS